MSGPHQGIGDWVRRGKRGKWHIVESVVAGDPFTRCGRRLTLDAGHGLEVSLTEPLTRLIGQPQLCRRCAP